jgi:hypothetical protein
LLSSQLFFSSFPLLLIQVLMQVKQHRAYYLIKAFKSVVALVTLTLPGHLPIKVFSQQPPVPAQERPQRTGRSYNGGDPPKKQVTSTPQSPSPVKFTDITASTGIDFQQASSATSQKYLLESMGGGVAMFDFDNDGRLDLFFTNGAKLQDPMPKGAMPDKRGSSFWNHLYRQKSDGTFEDVTQKAGLKGDGYGMGVATGDYDNDGFVDLYVTAFGGNVLYRNNGDGTFTDTTRKAGVGASGWSTSAGFIDYDRDGRLDIFVARYMDWDFEKGTLHCGELRPGYRAYCHPNNFKGASNLLYHQKADGTFEEVSTAAKIVDPDGKGLGVAFADFNNDGLPDIFVANDSVRQSLLKNNGDGTFEDIGLISGVGYDENGKTFAGMGVDAADYDNDGWPDLFVTALSNETYALYRNNGDESFTYSTNNTGVGQITLLYSGWGMRFLDFDNDGLRDVFVAQSHVLDTIEKTSSYLKYKQPPLLLRNTGKTFVNVSESAGQSFTRPLAARGAALGDIDNDGDSDIVIACLDGPPVVIRNDGSKNHWTGISLTGSKSNRFGIGARVTVIDGSNRRQIFDISTAGSYLSANDQRILAGIGSSTSIKMIEVRWPSGLVQSIPNPPIDKYITILERDAGSR